MDLQAEEVLEGADLMVDLLAPEGPSRVAVPLIKTIQETTKTLSMANPGLSTSYSEENRKEVFRALKRPYEYFYIYSPPGSLVVAATNKHERQRQQGPTPKAKDAKKLEHVGRKVYSTGGSNFV